MCCIDCHQWIKDPFLIARDLEDKCLGKVCCYPTSKNTFMCVSSEAFNNVIIYVKVLER